MKKPICGPGIRVFLSSPDERTFSARELFPSRSNSEAQIEPVAQAISEEIERKH